MSIPREGSRDTGQGIIVSVTPDVCMTPVGSSMVPVPYSVTAIQGDDANTVATVRMTSQRAHNMASLVTQCSGDAPGTGNGIVSATVGAVCHPMTHSGTVRINGEWAVRHSDQWHMNNRNTIGQLTFIETNETFEPTPAIILSQDPLLEAPEDVSPTVAAILRGMERASQDDESDWVQYAQAFEVQTDIPRTTTIPNSVANTTVTGDPGTAANDNRPIANRVSTPGASMTRPTLAQLLRQRNIAVPGARGVGLAGVAMALEPIGLSNLMSRDLGRLQADHGITLDPNNPYHTIILEEFTLNRGPSELSRSPIAIWNPNGMTSEAAAAIVRERLLELEALETAAVADEGGIDDASDAQSEITTQNVRVVAIGNSGGGGGDPCEFHQHSDKDCPQDYPSHHIIQDMFFRIGGRSSLERPDGAPNIGEGMSICLETSAHDELHNRVNARLREMGRTANLFELADISAEELKGVLQEDGLDCDDEIDALLQEFKDALGSDGDQLLGRSSNRPGSAAENVLRENWGLPVENGVQ